MTGPTRYEQDLAEADRYVTEGTALDYERDEAEDREAIERDERFAYESDREPEGGGE